ncbi:MAG: four helix bundle protein [Ignavibacteriaceae bacterium]
MIFSHEKLKVYQKSIDFIEFTNKVFPMDKFISAHNQLDRASTSIPLNIAEGTGKYSNKDKCRFYDIARGSALECAACLDVLFKRGRLSKELNEEGKNIIFEIVSMLIGLIKSSSNRIYEDEVEYNNDEINENS